MISARRGHLVVAKCLLSHGADPIACDYEALEPLEYCKRGDYRMKKLINRFASKSYSLLTLVADIFMKMKAVV